MILSEALKKLLSGAFTIRYPKQKPVIPERFRGKHLWDEKMCIFCLLCEKQCPTSAIKIDRERKTYTVDLGNCIFCGRCEQVCPTNAVKLGKKYELAVLRKEHVVKRI